MADDHDLQVAMALATVTDGTDASCVDQPSTPADGPADSLDINVALDSASSHCDDDSEGLVENLVKPELQYDAESLASPLVTLRVGPEAKILTAHKSILVKSSYFAKCLAEDRFEEGRKNEIVMLEEEPENMANILRFLYTNTVVDKGHRVGCGWSPFELGPTRSETISILIQMYVTADKYCIDEMCNEVVNQMRGLLMGSSFEADHVEQLRIAGLRGSLLWEIFISEMVAELFRDPSGGSLENLLESGLSSDHETGMEILVRVVSEIKSAALHRNCRCNSWARAYDQNYIRATGGDWDDSGA